MLSNKKFNSNKINKTEVLPVGKHWDNVLRPDLSNLIEAKEWIKTKLILGQSSIDDWNKLRTQITKKYNFSIMCILESMGFVKTLHLKPLKKEKNDNYSIS